MDARGSPKMEYACWLPRRAAKRPGPSPYRQE